MRDLQAFTVRLPEAEYEALKAYATYTRSSMGDVLLSAMRSYLGDAERADEFEAAVMEARGRVRETLEKFRATRSVE
jgi:hypothetical protein